MGRLIKYEFKGNYKFFLGIFLTAFVLNVILLLKKNSWGIEPVAALSILISVVLFTIIVILAIISFSKEIYEDRAYLTFTLPVKGCSVIGSKIIVSLIWFLLAGIYSCAFIILSADISMFEISKVFEVIGMKNISFLIFYGILSVVLFLIQVYFCIIFAKVVFRRKRSSKGLAFLVFIGLNMLSGYVQYLLLKIFSNNIFVNVNSYERGHFYFNISGNSAITVNSMGTTINTAAVVYNILLVVVLFIGTSYMLDNKLDI